MTAGSRIRLGRTPPVVLRGVDGDSYAIEAHENPPVLPTPALGDFPCAQLEYDDGNGLWITQKETPYDLG
jgi:hypothetical protein